MTRTYDERTGVETVIRMVRGGTWEVATFDHNGDGLGLQSGFATELEARMWAESGFTIVVAPGR